MTDRFRIEMLSGAHPRAAFSCGTPELDRYFHELVTQDVRRRVSNCFVALDEGGAVAAFYTLAATSLPLTELAQDEARRLPRYPLLPAGLIGRLAVDFRFRGRGLGAALIVDAVSRAMGAAPAIFALIVDAKDEPALNFYRHLGFHQFAGQPNRLFLPIAEAARRYIELASERGR